VARSSKSSPPAGEPDPSLLKESDFRTYLIETARIMAPGDIETALRDASEAREKATQDEDLHPRLARQVDLALKILNDHAQGECRQIPYWTISLLAVAVFYLLNPNDVVPDFIPRVGISDDALVFELAYQLAGDGVQRYCTANDVSTDGLLLRRDPAPQE
jgi:uncharacterized membrane protein YkvA (DUF1232 family)